MSPIIAEWLNLLLRWIHIIAGISWIGSSFYFMWLDSHLAPPSKGKENVTGELWMVHSGGFYQVEKRLIVPGQMPSTLHWFKWEAFFTWLSGFFLLLVVYYMGSGAYLIDSSVSSISATEARLIGLGLLPFSWLVYDGLYNSRLGKNKNLSTIISLGLLLAVIYGLTHTLSGRAAFIHVGAMLGTIMVANVWMRILPAQRQMIAATDRGEKPDYSLGTRAKLRSVHNNYVTFPVIFIMISNHFPSTYGNNLNWLILFGLMIASAGVRYVMNKRTILSRWVLLPAVAILAGLFVMTSPHKETLRINAQGEILRIDEKTSGTVSGTIRVNHQTTSFQSKDAVNFPAGCADQHAQPVYQNPLLIKNGLVQNAFVAITKGFEGKNFPVPEEDIIIDQKGCLYKPVVIGARVGQNVIFVNSDPVFHNVRSLDEKNVVFNEGMQNKGDKITKQFSTPELMVHAHCDVHPWMNAFIGVVDNPYFAVTDESGAFTLKNIPPGNYQVTVWQEALGTQTKDVVIKPQENRQMEVVFEGTK